MNRKTDQPMAILTDTTLCTGCEQCVRACKEKNALPEDRPRRWKGAIDDLSSTRFTTIVRHKPEAGPTRYVRRQCRHCLEPACASACIVGALSQTPQGAVVYDGKLCMGCRYCMVACPYGIPRYEWEKAAPYIKKCDFCADRIEKGEQPACTGACPEGATIYGTRQDLLAEAKRRVQAGRKKYVPRVYGETEVGGTSVLYVSDVPLGFLAWKPELGKESLPDLTWAALGKVPPIVVGVGGAMAATWWIVGRRMQLQAERQLAEATAKAEEPGQDDPEGGK